MVGFKICWKQNYLAINGIQNIVERITIEMHFGFEILITIVLIHLRGPKLFNISLFIRSSVFLFFYIFENGSGSNVSRIFI